MNDECQCIWADDQWHECEYCYLKNEEEQDQCTCQDDEININCTGCF